jgi:hypothetical protein
VVERHRFLLLMTGWIGMGKELRITFFGVGKAENGLRPSRFLFLCFSVFFAFRIGFLSLRGELWGRNSYYFIVNVMLCPDYYDYFGARIGVGDDNVLLIIP